MNKKISTWLFERFKYNQAMTVDDEPSKYFLRPSLAIKWKKKQCMSLIWEVFF